MKYTARVITQVNEQDGAPYDFSFSPIGIGLALLLLLVVILLLSAYRTWIKTVQISKIDKPASADFRKDQYKVYISKIDLETIRALISKKKESIRTRKLLVWGSPLWLSILTFSEASAQTQIQKSAPLSSHPGIIITLVLLAIPLIAAIIILVVKVRSALYNYRNKLNQKESEAFISYLDSLDEKQLNALIGNKKQQLEFSLRGNELSGQLEPQDERGLLEIQTAHALPFVAVKKKALKRPEVDTRLTKVIVWYLSCSAFWLVFGTTVGEYLGIKFVAPDADHISWLSFGRLRPVHTNAVFWGWASLAMLGLAHYVIPRVSNAKIFSLKLAWYALGLINASVILGSLFLMAGINNGGGEYREYIWPIMLLFAIGLILTLINFLCTVASRTTREIYISSWYIISAVIFVLVITVVAYLPFWQNGIGETVIQGYYMHQGVGMWFMLFTLGLVYYFLPQQLNRPIYSYSLGILAFWTQILFYTTIGTHHFVFSAIPWWLQTVAIVGSVGMIIPVVAGTTNFLMTFKGAWHKVSYSYSLPFFLVGIIFYFTGSLQGIAEAFRYTNLIWHFTDFTVAHSHLTMYAIISFFLWACIYAIVPRLSGREAPQITIGAHFWLALIGLLFYTVPLMYGSTLRGLMWMDGKPFIDSVALMAPYWLWRAIGGSLMWLSHLFFAYNLYKMLSFQNIKGVPEITREKLVPPITLVNTPPA